MSFMKATMIFKEMLGKILLIFQPVWKVLIRVLLLEDGEGQGSTRVFKCPLEKLLVPESFITLLATASSRQGSISPAGSASSCDRGWIQQFWFVSGVTSCSSLNWAFGLGDGQRRRKGDPDQPSDQHAHRKCFL